VSNGLPLAAYSYVKEIPLTQGFVALHFGAFAALNFPDNPDERHAQ
jgi:hypothetical protein